LLFAIDSLPWDFLRSTWHGAKSWAGENGKPTGDGCSNLAAAKVQVSAPHITGAGDGGVPQCLRDSPYNHDFEQVSNLGA
jgi:hypothetical protein